MPNNNLALQTIEAIYASGLDSGRWPEALKLTTNLLGGVGTFLEAIDKPSQRHSLFSTIGVPAGTRVTSIKHFAALAPRMPSNPRRSFSVQQHVGHVAWDYQILDEAGMARDPFYAEFIPQFGLRYFLGAVIEQTSEKFTFVTVQRTKKQGHVEKREIGLMQHLSPHFQRAHDMATRLKATGDGSGVLENTLDWLTDGVALLRADGQIVYANSALNELAQRCDGFRIADRNIEFAEPDSRRRLGAALGAVERIGDFRDARPTDFPVPRRDGMPAYIVSVRPLVRGKRHTIQHAQAEIVLLVRDPLSRSAAAIRILQELFGLTNAEAHLAQALCTGATTGAYALERDVSLNTVYSHLKRIREKTGCKSLAEFLRKFSELSVPLRLS